MRNHLREAVARMFLTDQDAAEVEAHMRREHRSDAWIFAVMVGCPNHGNAYMDWDDDGPFCHSCEV